MAGNSRFAIAVHTLGVLAFAEGGHVSSDSIARSVNTNPVVIRRMIARFVKHGIVTVRMGTGGGSILIKPPVEITLAEIYNSLDEDPLFLVPPLGSDHPCPVGKLVRPVLEGLFGGVEITMRKHLESVSLKDVMDEVESGLKGQCR